MAAIGLAASIIAVIQITTSVTTQAYKYGQSVKNATKDIAKVLDHLKEVEDSLTKLGDLVNQAEMLEKPLKSWPTLVALSSPNGALQQCNLAMMALYANLTPVDGPMEIIERARWPVKKKKVEQCLKDIVTQKNVFIESLNVEHIGQSLETGHVVSQMAKIQSDESRRKIIKWLFVTDPDTNQKAARKLHEDETSEWFTEGRDYLRWKEEPNAFLWLYGLPGCGKTILCSEIIEQTRRFCSDRPTDRALAYFYFSFRDTDKQMTTNLLRSLLSQLLQQSESISNLVRILYDSYSHTQPPTDQLLSSIKSMIDSHRNRNVFIIIDALDECPNEGGERGDLCDCLRTIKEWAASNLHVLVTSRSLVELTDSLDALCTIDSISIEGAAVESDIRKFIRTQLSNDRKLQKWPTEIQGEIEKALTHGAQGMFLWVACQLNSLRKCVTASDVDKVLKSLPKTLDNTYERILMSIDTEHIQIAHIALRWISHAHKPVTIEELAEAVIIDLTACPSVNPRNRIPEPSWLMEILTGLVTISRRERDWTRDNWMVYTPNYIHCVEIAHYSVTEYLNSSRILNTPAYMFYISNENAAEDIVQKCLCYITCYSVSNRKKESHQDLKEFPLLQYASHFWHKQLLANEDTITCQTKDLVFDFLASKTSLSSWLLVYHPDAPYNLPFSTDRNNILIGTPLYYAIELEIRSLVSYLVGIGAKVCAVGEGSCNAAATATLNSDARGVCGFALESAVWAGNRGILQLLLEARANVNAQDGDYGAALHTASSLGNLEFVALLIKDGANANADTEKYGTPLEAAFECGLGDAEDHMDVIELLLAAGADPGILCSEEIELIQDTRTLKKLLADGIDRTMIKDEMFAKFREPIKGWPSG